MFKNVKYFLLLGVSKINMLVRFVRGHIHTHIATRNFQWTFVGGCLIGVDVLFVAIWNNQLYFVIFKAIYIYSLSFRILPSFVLCMHTIILSPQTSNLPLTATSGRFLRWVGVYFKKRPLDVSCGNMSMDVAPNNLHWKATDFKKSTLQKITPQIDGWVARSGSRLPKLYPRSEGYPQSRDESRPIGEKCRTAPVHFACRCFISKFKLLARGNK